MSQAAKKNPKLNAQNRKEIGLELRKSHFQLGNDGILYSNSKKDVFKLNTRRII